MQSVEEVVHQLSQERFYGSLELKFEAGRVVLLRKTETIKPAATDCRENRGIQDERLR